MIREDIVEETERLVAAAERGGVVLRPLGGMAIDFPVGERHRSLAREIGDIDFATPKGESRRARDFLDAEGYEPDLRFDATPSARRLLFVVMVCDIVGSRWRMRSRVGDRVCWYQMPDEVDGST
jgi:hypothetical protein